MSPFFYVTAFENVKMFNETCHVINKKLWRKVAAIVVMKDDTISLPTL